MTATVQQFLLLPREVRERLVAKGSLYTEEGALTDWRGYQTITWLLTSGLQSSAAVCPPAFSAWWNCLPPFVQLVRSQHRDQVSKYN